MSEGLNGQKVDVYESNRFSKALARLPEKLLRLVEDEIERVIINSELGELKKGDLSYLRVHKFQLNSQLVLLSYSWIGSKLALYFLGLGSHENFYQEQKCQRKSDLKLIE